MQFLVLGENVEVGALLPPPQVVATIEQLIIPSLQMLTQWDQEGRITGGLSTGERGGGFILEADSPEEVDRLLSSLPFWGLVKWQVRALHSFADGATNQQHAIEKVKEMLGEFVGSAQ